MILQHAASGDDTLLGRGSGGSRFGSVGSEISPDMDEEGPREHA